MEIIVGKTAGFCYGVKRAVNGAKTTAIDTSKKVYCLGEIVHNKQVVKNLEKDGIDFIEQLDEAKKSNSIVLIRAHGVNKDTYKTAKKIGIEIKDFTCPNVLKIHDIAEEYMGKGYFIILVGATNHPENIGTISFCGKNSFVLQNIEDMNKVVEKIKESKIKKVLLIAQTTYNLEKFNKIQEKMQNDLEKEKVELEIKNTICKATELRQNETKKIAKEVEVMIIIGGKNSSNTKKLYEIAKNNCKIVQCVETKEELDLSEIKDCKKIGIMAGASTPKESIDEVCKKIGNI